MAIQWQISIYLTENTILFNTILSRYIVSGLRFNAIIIWEDNLFHAIGEWELSSGLL